jgi:hypothetical protein
VVRGEQQHVLVLGDPDQQRTQQRTPAKVEGAHVLLVEHVVEVVGPGQDDHRHVQLVGWVHDLDTGAVDLVERGPQRLVPGQQPLEGGGEGRHVQTSGQAQGECAVVAGAVLLELVQEPQSLL